MVTCLRTAGLSAMSSHQQGLCQPTAFVPTEAPRKPLQGKPDCAGPPPDHGFLLGAESFVILLKNVSKKLISIIRI